MPNFKKEMNRELRCRQACRSLLICLVPPPLPLRCRILLVATVCAAELCCCPSIAFFQTWWINMSVEKPHMCFVTKSSTYFLVGLPLPLFLSCSPFMQTLAFWRQACWRGLQGWKKQDRRTSVLTTLRIFSCSIRGLWTPKVKLNFR